MSGTYVTDNDVRLQIYSYFREHGRPPTAEETAGALSLSTAQAMAAYRRLAGDHVIVLQPGTYNIWMANPWSAVPTSFEVEASGRHWWGNCIWDALGIIAMLGGPGQVTTGCPDCADPLTISVQDGTLRPAQAVVHFAVPAAHWWDDIGYT